MKRKPTAAPKPKRDASPRRDNEKNDQRSAILYFQGGPNEYDEKFVIPECALESKDWTVFAYWSMLGNVHTADKTKVPGILKDAEAKCYASLFAGPGDETVTPPWRRFKDKRRHSHFEFPTEHFTISVFE